MFEPLTKLLDKHGNDFKSILHDVRIHLAQIVENTRSKVAGESIGFFNSLANTEKGKTTELRLRVSDGYMWRVFHTVATGSKAGSCAVYMGNISPQSLVDVISGGLKVSNSEYYVSSGTELIFHFYEQEENQVCTFSIQVEQLKAETEHTDRRSISHDVSDIDKRLSEPERHRPPRTEKPSVDELRRSMHTP